MYLGYLYFRNYSLQKYTLFRGAYFMGNHVHALALNQMRNKIGECKKKTISLRHSQTVRQVETVEM